MFLCSPGVFPQVTDYLVDVHGTLRRILGCELRTTPGLRSLAETQDIADRSCL
jgi:hypothetical protein